MKASLKKAAGCVSYSCVVITLFQFVFVVAAIEKPASAQTLTGYWRFDDGSGNRAADSSGNGHTATLVNGISWVTGKIGGAVSANATRRQYISIPAIDLSGTKALTVALWTNRTYSTVGGHTLFAATKDYSKSTTGFAFLPDDQTCLGIQVALRGSEGSTANCYSQPSSGVWHHLAVVYDKSQTGGDEIKFYVDGALQTVNRNLYATTNTNNFGNNPIYLFSRGGSSQYASGIVDDFRIYNSALTSGQIQQIMNSGPTLSSLTITPANPSVAVGAQQAFNATGIYSDGSQQNLTNSVTWTSSAPSVATISSGGVATGIATGSSTIQASSGAISSTTGLTVAAQGSLSYSTSFPATENPMSEGGNWVCGHTVGLDWHDVQTTSGFAWGTQTGNTDYDDSICALTGSWGPQQTAQATVKLNGTDSGVWEELEVFLHLTISAHNATGYEINCSVKSNAPYIQIVRWNGPLASFTELNGNGGYYCKNGDVLKATIDGSGLITVYHNGAAVLSATDNTFTSGSPGIGMYLQNGTGPDNSYGFSAYSATEP